MRRLTTGFIVNTVTSGFTLPSLLQRAYISHLDLIFIRHLNITRQHLPNSSNHNQITIVLAHLCTAIKFASEQINQERKPYGYAPIFRTSTRADY